MSNKSSCREVLSTSFIFNRCHSKGIIVLNDLISDCEIDFEVNYKRSGILNKTFL